MNLRIIFMGTPDFAVSSLERLLKAGMNIVGVVTSADKRAGRGLKVMESDVKRFAIQHNLRILQPEKLKNEEFIRELQELKADLQVVVAFRMLPEVVWNMPRLGTVNLHGSLLPQYRGAAPINWAIINGEKETGVTTFRLKHEIDTGDILLSEKISIGEDETVGELHDRMKVIGAELLLQTIEGLESGSLSEKPQESCTEEKLKTAPRIYKETGMIDYNKPIEVIYNLVRGLSPYPAAYIMFEGKILKIFKAGKITASVPSIPGKIETDYKTFLRFHGNDGQIDILELQLEGKRKMNVLEFLRGWKPKLTSNS